MKPWTFTHACDLHLGSPKSYRYDPRRNTNWATARKQMETMNPDLLLVGGDLTRDGDTHEWEFDMVKQDFESLPFPAYIIPGNMDVGNKRTDRQGPGHEEDGRDDIALNVRSDLLTTFATYFGPVYWTFTHKNVRFTGFYDGVFGSGLPEEDRTWAMLERLPSLPRTPFHVVVIHYALFIDDIHEPNFDITKKDEYLSWYFGIDEPHRGRLVDIFKNSAVDIVFSGHIHCRRPVQHVEGFRFYQTSAVGGQPQWADKWPNGDTRIGFNRCEVTDSGIEVTFIPVDPISNEQDYGPYGPPPVEDRDYSVAWEK